MPTDDEFERLEHSREIRVEPEPDNKFKCDSCFEVYTESERDKENGCEYCGGVLTKI